MQKNEIFELNIEKLINDGKFLAHKDTMPVFIENVCPGDIVKAKAVKINKSYIVAEPVEIIKYSPDRETPVCSLSKICGSCDFQYIKYEEQLKQKQNVVYEIMNKHADEDCVFENIIPSPQIKEYRCKIQYPVSQTKNSKRILTGYYKKKSHELVNIKYCPMNPPIINEINEYLKELIQNSSIDAYSEKTHKGLLRHIIYRVSSDFSQILIILVINSVSIPRELKKISEVIINKYPQIKGVCVNFNTQKTNVITGEKTEVISGVDFYEEKLSNYKYRISKTSFFQVNPYCAEQIFLKVKKLITENTKKPTILDAYSGVSAFGVFLSDIAEKVVCIEEVESASYDAVKNAEANNISNMQIINGDASMEFSKLISSCEKFDVVVTDPPRKGCSEESVQNLVKLTDKFILYVSCNPATLSRDAEYLKKSGFSLVYLCPADMFPHTKHVETIALFKKKEA